MYTFEAKNFPTSPGVYLMKSVRGKILYVGKAKNLRARLSSYFRNDAGHSVKTTALVARIEGVDVLLTASEKEALLLESSLIKKHRPRYNVVLKDDKNYILFKLDKRSPFPRLAFTRRVERDGAAYFGPFTSAAAARATWKELGRLFPLRKCGDRALANRVRPCLYHFIGQCLAPCVLAVNADQYTTLVRRVEAFLTGRSAEVLKSVQREMEAAAESLAFEKAAGLRDLLRAMRKTVEGQATVLTKLVDMDVVNFTVTEAGVGLCVLFVRQGRLLDRKTFFFPGVEAGEAVSAAVTALLQFYRPESFIPPRIVVPEGLAPGGGEGEAAGDGQALAEILEERRGMALRLGPARGREERQLLEMAAVNAGRAAEEAAKAAQSDVLPSLARAFGLAHLARIEAVDVSHLGGKGVRVGLVVFEDGAPRKSEYRSYAIAAAEGSSDDYLALAAFATRRAGSGPPWPDLLLIDGGKGQLGAVGRALDEAGVGGAFALASIAKGDRRSQNEMDDVIFVPGRKNPLPLRSGSPELLFLQRIRDTVHDYSIGRQRQARHKVGLKSDVLALPGVGPKTARLLWEAFGSVAAMRAASAEDIRARTGLGPTRSAAVASALAGLAD
ncbi:excinuclease ABC subunit UvrC [Desulfovibrio aerotolerans]|uniref:UvrABC system protein C n=1 Tax=Solidesulfovibrio aerotolerans TaxID=295255 RepID=A0A7C9IVG5_9BACT|nr:excinuclease ABC subunit UvrC [Solidesulfovibrio aerotolerans]MYL82602.1 excinuclease ABC subunit UvrC [Solidesulfovibrio aerotolerans]